MSTTDSQIKSVNGSHKRTTLIIVLASVAFIGLLAFGLQLDQSKVPSAILATKANAFSVAWLQGQEHLANSGSTETKNFSLDDFKGNLVVLNFWASWCPSCRTEARELEAYWQEAKSKGVYVVGIAFQDEPEAARRSATAYGKSYIIGLDEDGKAPIDYGVAGAPETFIIDREGVIRHKFVGPVTIDQLRDQVNKLL